MGTLRGRLFLFESATFGLLAEITSEPSDEAVADGTSLFVPEASSEDFKNLKEISAGNTGVSEETGKICSDEHKENSEECDDVDVDGDKSKSIDEFLEYQGQGNGVPGEEAIVSLYYVARDDLVVVAYVNGTIKVCKRLLCIMV